MEFTMEMEKDNRISFLDVAVTRRDGTLTTEVYRKPTYTELYTHYTSHHHPSVKAGTVRNLGRRAETICDGESKKKEFEHPRNTFRQNGYPENVIAWNLRRPPSTALTMDIDDEEIQRREAQAIVPAIPEGTITEDPEGL